VYRQADQKEKEKMERCTRKTLRGITCIMSKVNNKISGRKHATKMEINWEYGNGE
jgi:hypothetical protein